MFQIFGGLCWNVLRRIHHQVLHISYGGRQDLHSSTVLNLTPGLNFMTLSFSYLAELCWRGCLSVSLLFLSQTLHSEQTSCSSYRHIPYNKFHKGFISRIITHFHNKLHMH